MGYDLIIAGPERRALFDLRGARAALAARLPDRSAPWPDRPCSRRAVATDAELLWVGPARWLLLAPAAAEPALEQALRPDDPPQGASLHRVSDAFAFVALSGADAGAAMAIACPLDLHPDSFPADAATFSEAFGVRALIMRAADGFALAVDASHADFVAAHLAQIAAG